MKKAFMGMLLLAALLLGGCTHEDEEICREEQYSAKPVIYIYPEETSDAKPVIYLRPEAVMDVTVQLDYAGTLTCTYPAYDGGWHVSAAPDGTLTDASGQTYRYLYWEGRETRSMTFQAASACPETRPPRFWKRRWTHWG